VHQIRFGTYEVLVFECGTKIRVYAEQRRLRKTTRELLLIVFPPTAGFDCDKLARPGDWLINHIHKDPASVNLFVQRDESLDGLASGGRQSRFIDDRYRRYTVDGMWEKDDASNPDCPIKREGTVSAYANAKSITRVGSNFARSGKLAFYSAMAFSSGREPLDGDQRRSVDQSLNIGGMSVTGTRTGSVQRLSGTSLASPMVAAEICQKLG